VTNFLGWQARIVRELKRPDQFVTHNFVGGIRTNLDQWAIARDLDVAVGTPIAERPPHRSVRAELPHTAPPLDTSVEADVG
jgi:hypothetical protein